MLTTRPPKPLIKGVSGRKTARAQIWRLAVSGAEVKNELKCTSTSLLNWVRRELTILVCFVAKAFGLRQLVKILLLLLVHMPIFLCLDAFAELLKATISFVMSVCPSVLSSACIISGLNRNIFMKFDIQKF
jgi:hypothetical protein